MKRRDWTNSSDFVTIGIIHNFFFLSFPSYICSFSKSWRLPLIVCLASSLQIEVDKPGWNFNYFSFKMTITSVLPAVLRLSPCDWWVVLPDRCTVINYTVFLDRLHHLPLVKEISSSHIIKEISSHIIKEIPSSHIIKEISSSHKIKEISSSNKIEEIPSSHIIKEIPSSHIIKEISSSHKIKEISSSHIIKEISSLSSSSFIFKTSISSTLS